MSRTWFTSDLHLGHPAILRHCNRPFASVSEMDAALVDGWNGVVQPGDDVWVCGDFALGSAETVAHYLRRLKGRKHLVWGNHDRSGARTVKCWASSQGFADVTVEGQRLVLLHYALRVWPAHLHGSLHLYGHSHGHLQGDRQSLDVGVDCWGYRPISLDEIRERMATLPERERAAA